MGRSFETLKINGPSLETPRAILHAVLIEISDAMQCKDGLCTMQVCLMHLSCTHAASIISIYHAPNPRNPLSNICNYPLQLLLQQALHPPLNRIQILSRSNVIFASSLPTRKRQILRHDTVNINGIHTCLFERLRECYNFWRLVEDTSLDQSSGPSEDRGNGVGGCLVAFLVFSVVARDGPMGGF
jgi:hypothetical protein